MVDTNSGQVGHSYGPADELDGYTYVRCGNRRAAVCPTCRREYKGDAWHVLMCGLAGGKGIPTSVAEHPCTFATLTAPSFGPQDSGLVFTCSRGTPMEPDNLRRSWYALRVELGDPPPRFDDLRHTCVSLLLADGAPPHVVQQIVGHSAIDVAMSIYAHASLVQQIVGHSAIDVAMSIYAHASLDEKRTALDRLGQRLA